MSWTFCLGFYLRSGGQHSAVIVCAGAVRLRAFSVAFPDFFSSFEGISTSVARIDRTRLTVVLTDTMALRSLPAGRL